MPINQDFVGRVLAPSQPYEVSRAKIREFAEAIGDDNPAYTSREAATSLGYDDVIAPPTFAIVMAMRLHHDLVHDPALGLDYSKVVHGEQQFVHHRPIQAGDILIGTPRVDDIKSRAGNDMLTWSAEIATVEGEPVCKLTSTLVARGTAAPA
ncbi:MAG: MaoC family dehydratase N-terminal domain-containing protein [Actinomycetota bacterium]